MRHSTAASPFRSLLAAVTLVSVFAPLPTAAQYFVSPAGSDTGPGTVAQPFRTIQRAADVMTAGDTCFIMVGTYRETVVPANNGAPGTPLVFTPYQNDKVIITGTDAVSGWTAHQNGIYKVHMPDSVMQLSVDKEMANEARYPNARNNNLSKSGWKPVSIAVNGNATYTGMNFPAGYWVGGHAVAVVAAKWIAENGKIDSSSGNVVHCTERSNPWLTYTSAYYIGSGHGYITQHLHALDTINEWHWQNDTLYYYPEDPGALATMETEARTRMYGFDCTGREYVELHDLHFTWATVSFEEATGCLLDGGSVWFPSPSFYYTMAWGRQAHDSTNYGISSWEGKGVALSGNGNTIRNCYVAHSWGDGISVGGQNNTVENCLVEDCDWSATDCGALTTVGVGHNVTHNTLRSTGRSVVVNRLSNQTDITYNDMHDCGLLTEDLGITYSYHSNGGGSHIAYNWVHDNHATGSAMGIYLDNFDTAYVVHHNVVWNCANAIQTNKPAVDHQIYNNTVWACTNAMGTWGNPGTTIQNQVVRNNLSNMLWNQGTTFSNNLVSTNPLFTDAAAHDFTLTAGSPAIDYGVDVPGITDGYVGAAPDAGAYEYGLTPWVPGSSTTPTDVSEIYIDSTQQATGVLESVATMAEGGLLVQPNPTSGSLQVISASSTSYMLLDAMGHVLTSGRFALGVSTLDLGAYPTGLYLLRCEGTAVRVVRE